MIAWKQKDRLHRPVLVLNASYEPINVCAARRALVLVLKGVASAEEHSHGQLRSARREVPVPSVIRLLEYRRMPHQTRALSRKNILMRDRYTCQYCHKTLNAGELTLDYRRLREFNGLWFARGAATRVEVSEDNRRWQLLSAQPGRALFLGEQEWRWLRLRYEGRFTPPSEQGSIIYPGNFGVFNWGSIAVDPVRGIAFTTPAVLAWRRRERHSATNARDRDAQ